MLASSVKHHFTTNQPATLMKTNTPTLAACFALVAVLLLACSGSRDSASAILEKSGIRCDYDLGDYRLQNTAVRMLPYENKTKAVFADSLGRTDTFDISFVSKRSSRQLHNVYNGFVQGDTVRYCYLTQYFHCMLESKKSNLQFKITVAAKPVCLDQQSVCPDAASKKPVDAIDISFCDGKVAPRHHFGIFHKVMGDTSTDDVRGKRLVYPEIEFLGRQFKQVERIEYDNKPPDEVRQSRLYYSTGEGIVAFSINNGPLRRLVTMF